MIALKKYVYRSEDGGDGGGGSDGAGGSGFSASSESSDSVNQSIMGGYVAPPPSFTPAPSDYAYGDGQSSYQQAIADVNKYRAASTPSAANLAKVFVGGPVGLALGVSGIAATSSEAYNALSDSARALVKLQDSAGAQNATSTTGGNARPFNSALPSVRGNGAGGNTTFSLNGGTAPIALPNIGNAPVVGLDFGDTQTQSKVNRQGLVEQGAFSPMQAPAKAAAAAPASSDTIGKWASILTVITLGISLLKGHV